MTTRSANTVYFAFFIILATTMNFGFFYGDTNSLEQHPIYELFVVIAVNFIALTLKFGNKTQIDSIQLPTGIVSCIQLIIGAFLWFYASENGTLDIHLATIVGLSGGALIANFFSMILLVVDAIITKR